LDNKVSDIIDARYNDEVTWRHVTEGGNPLNHHRGILKWNWTKLWKIWNEPKTTSL